MSQKTRTELTTLMNAYILQGGKRTTAVNMKALFAEFIESVLNALDDANNDEGYLKISASGLVDYSKVADAAPIGKFLKDNGTMDHPNIHTVLNDTNDLGNTAISETDLSIYSMPANTLNDSGDHLVAEFSGSFAAHVTANRRLRFYFGGITIFDSGTFVTSSGVSWVLRITVVRKDSGIAKCNATLSYGAVSQTFSDEITGLALVAITNVKLTGTAGAAGANTNDIIRELGLIKIVKGAA